MPATTRTTTLILAIVIALTAIGLRAAWLTADPPSDPTVGIVWHDEGAWVHNARNRALWGVWRTDAWNPMYLAPVFTAAEYVAFSTLGVGTRQARVVPLLSGLLAIAALALGLHALAGGRAALVGALLLSTCFFFVMWNRAALLESTMTAALACGWGAYARAHGARSAGRHTRWASSPAALWGLLAGAAATTAFFTKAAAAFFIAALICDAALTLALAWQPAIAARLRVTVPSSRERAAAIWTMVGLAIAGAIAAILFVVPYWTEFRFYNWEMSVTRKPSYTVRAFMDRTSWLPIVHDVLSRMWPIVVVALAALVSVAARWRTAPPALRLLALWLVAGIAEMIVHDTGNERRYVMLIPAFVALAAWAIARVADDERDLPDASRWLLAPIVLGATYLAAGSAIRLIDVERIYAHDLAWAVRPAAAIAGLVTIAFLVVFRGAAATRWLRLRPWSATGVVAFVTLMLVIDGAQYAHWAYGRTDFNHRASIALRDLVAPQTLVHGKLANGLSLENRIRPVFIGRGFGNYADRLTRSDVRYLLTYTEPALGYEGPVILDVLSALPRYQVIASMPVQETPDTDLAALVDKFPDRGAPAAVASSR